MSGPETVTPPPSGVGCNAKMTNAAAIRAKRIEVAGTATAPSARSKKAPMRGKTCNPNPNASKPTAKASAAASPTLVAA